MRYRRFNHVLSRFEPCVTDGLTMCYQGLNHALPTCYRGLNHFDQTLPFCGIYIQRASHFRSISYIHLFFVSNFTHRFSWCPSRCILGPHNITCHSVHCPSRMIYACGHTSRHQQESIWRAAVSANCIVVSINHAPTSINMLLCENQGRRYQDHQSERSSRPLCLVIAGFLCAQTGLFFTHYYSSLCVFRMYRSRMPQGLRPRRDNINSLISCLPLP